jgi:hypothetical protein
MYSSDEICEKITTMYPEIGECGAELNVRYDEQNKAWLVHMKKDNHELNHYLELNDATECLDGTQCVSLGLDMAQMFNNIEEKQF